MEHGTFHTERALIGEAIGMGKCSGEAEACKGTVVSIDGVCGMVCSCSVRSHTDFVVGPGTVLGIISATDPWIDAPLEIGDARDATGSCRTGDARFGGGLFIS